MTLIMDGQIMYKNLKNRPGSKLALGRIKDLGLDRKRVFLPILIPKTSLGDRGSRRSEPNENLYYHSHSHGAILGLSWWNTSYLTKTLKNLLPRLKRSAIRLRRMPGMMQIRGNAIR